MWFETKLPRFCCLDFIKFIRIHSGYDKKLILPGSLNKDQKSRVAADLGNYSLWFHHYEWHLSHFDSFNVVI